MLKITHPLLYFLFMFSLAFSANDNVTLNKIVQNKVTNEIISFSLYPNPTKEKVEITLSKPINTNINIFDNLGNIVFEVPTENKSKILINFKDLAAGIYFVCVKTEQKTIIKRLIKY